MGRPAARLRPPRHAPRCSRFFEIQPNPIPGDDGEDDLYAPEHPAAQALLLTTTPTPDPGLRTRLDSIEGLTHLNHETA
ncbi:hypothetical protein LRR80_06663 [Streptomyces sp. RO-S4]|nr:MULTISPECIES: hypothetical protein [unclassified Streptomyces]MCO4700553.1 hypothetical protein [Streptomyces sp. RO-S4]MDU0300076.1 hypothetical protein [Streptomyces sp. PAL114]